MQQEFQLISKDLVLIGGGHAHAIALRLFGMQPLPGVRLTLISDGWDTPYSGMLPGYVAGFYSREECHIDLYPLTQFAGAQFYIDRVIGLDLVNNRVLCANRPPVAFDVLSIDIGSTPQLPQVLGDPTAIIAAKPVRQFLQRWQQVVQQVSQNPQRPIRLAIIGGGAGGVELALTMQHRLQQILQAAQQPLSQLSLHLFQRDADLLPNHNRWVRQHFRQLLTQRGIHLHLQQTVIEVQPGQVHCQSGLTVECDAIFWVTQAAAPDWLGQAGLAVDEAGFIQVDDCLRSLSHAQVFAAGDIASMVHHPRPKAGVFAVRQGAPLFHNLRQTLQDQPLQPFQPQRQYLSLIGTGDGTAVASRGPFGWQSPLLWRWKDHIDRAFMRQFSQLTPMAASRQEPGAGSLTPAVTMRCAGCGAKVGNTVLQRVLQRIQNSAHGSSPVAPAQADILIGLDTPDDAAVLQVPDGMVLVQTIDAFPALVSDPFRFGQIAANHALNDLYAMAARPQSALAIATLPYALPDKVEETLYQLLSGAIQVLHQADAVLVGGHTTEGSQLSFGLTCNGLAYADRLLRKSGMAAGQVLILTKPLGTGVLFAAQMRGQAKGAWIETAIATMLQSNQTASLCLQEWGATACTDVTGFGLLGHLLEMVQASEVSVSLDLAAIPLLDGTLEMAQRGIVSSLYSQNLEATRCIENLAAVELQPSFPLLFDPQTAGGLLASVPANQGDRCLQALQTLGYSHSAIIGRTIAPQENQPSIQISWHH
jgi:selenide,water dikinase